jgi:hypothetical protein
MNEQRNRQSSFARELKLVTNTLTRAPARFSFSSLRNSFSVEGLKQRKYQSYQNRILNVFCGLFFVM